MLLIIFLFALLGMFVGSFINVCIDRLPRGQSIIHPPSYCSACNQRLGFLDLIPLLSYTWLRGRCRYCRAHIPFRLPLVEGVTGLLFSFLSWNYGLGLELGIFLVYTGLLVIIFFIDLEHQLVLDKISYPGMVIVFALSFFSPGLREVSLLVDGTVGQALSALVGGVLGLVLMALPFIVYRRGMGMGDIKLGALIGLMTGYPLVIIAVILSWISGGLVAAILLTLKIKGRKDAIPFAPFLVIAALITLLWGQEIWKWYLY
ncbi:prepilin peptidase [Chloroflexota bacterium]